MRDLKAEDRIAQLEAEMVLLRDQLAQVLARIHELERQRSKDSHNSHQPTLHQHLGSRTGLVEATDVIE